MENNSEDFDKIFNEMVESDDLQEVSKAVSADVTSKDLLYVMHSLLETVEHIVSALSNVQEDPEALNHINTPDVKNIFKILYKASDDFNDALVELIIENDILDSGIEFFEDFEDDDEN